MLRNHDFLVWKYTFLYIIEIHYIYVYILYICIVYRNHLISLYLKAWLLVGLVSCAFLCFNRKKHPVLFYTCLQVVNND